MRGLFYSQSIKNYDLPILSLSLCKSLIQECEIDFLYGSPAVRSLLLEPRFHCLTLPSFEKKEERLAFMQKEVKPPYHFFITEGFPFGKIPCREEIFFLIDLLKRHNRSCRIVSSVPDIVQLYKPSLREKALKIFSERYDAVFFHADPSVINMEEFFPEASTFQNKVFATGFVPNSLEMPSDIHVKRKKQILIPISWQEIGELLMRAVLAIMNRFPDYEFAFVMPLQHPLFLEEILHTWAARHEGIPMRIVPYQRSLESLLRTSALSISMADAHLIDLVNSKTPGLALANSEAQTLRLVRFAQQGVVTAMTYNDLHPDRLAQLVTAALEAPYPDRQIDMQGAQHTLELLKKL